MTVLVQEIAQSLYDGDQAAIAMQVRDALKRGVPATDILSEGLISGMDRVGADFKVGELFTPEVLIAARAMHAALDILRPLLAQNGAMPAGRCVLGTVKGDLHDIGKNLVRMMLEGAGFEVIDLGTDVSPQDFVASVRTHQPDLLGMSALLTTTMPAMRTTVEAIENANLRHPLKILVGGAPVTAGFAAQIGADGYAPDSAVAVELARELVSRSGTSA